MSLLRLASTLLAAVFGIASAPGAAAATINVTAGQNLNQILEDAAAGDVVVVGPGTYTAQGTVCLPNAAQFSIRKPLTVMSSDGPEATILQQPDTGGPLPAVLITHGVCTSSFVADVVLEGFTLVDGVAVATQGIPAQRIRLGNLLVNSSAPRPGVSFENARDSTIDGSVVDVLGRAISVTNSRDVFVTNNSLRTTGATQAVYLDQTLNSVVAGNTVWGAGADAILLSATTSSRFERNTISGHRYDGIRVTNGVSASSSNFIGYNTIVSNGWAGGIETSGNGIVLSGNSNGNFVFGNNVSGSPGHGVAINASSSNVVQANRVHGNYAGGILIANDTSTTAGVGAIPYDNVIRGNHVYFNVADAVVNLRGTQRTDIAFNHLSALNFAGDGPNPNVTPGASGTVYSKDTYTKGVGMVGFQNHGVSIYENTTLANYYVVGMHVSGDVGASYFRNRVFGLQRATPFVDTPSSVTLDAGALMGGNFTSGITLGGKNPNNGPPIASFCSAPNYGGAGPLCPNTRYDNYAFSSESLGQAAPVVVELPRAGSTVAAGSIKTIRWRSEGCTYVDIDLMSGASVISTIVANAPDIGVYVWTVPASQGAGSYSVRVSCKNSGSVLVGLAGKSGAFSIAPVGLALLGPGPFSVVDPGTMVVSWARGPGVTSPVDVFLSVDGGPETNPASGITGNQVRISVPGVATNRLALRIAAGALQDSSDGYFSTSRSAGSGVTSIAPLQKVAYGTRLPIEWISPPGSRFVDIELDTFQGTEFQAIAMNVPDFGAFEWLANADFMGGTRRIRLTFKTTMLDGSPGLGQVLSNSFEIVGTPDVFVSQSAPAQVNFGRDIVYVVTAANAGPVDAANVVLTNALPAGATFLWTSPGCSHSSGTVTCNIGTLPNGAIASYKIVVRPTAAGTATNQASITTSNGDLDAANSSSSANVAVTVGPTPVAVQRYRLYSDVTKEHHFTTDLNEYNTLGTYVGTWVKEGPSGKVLDNPGSFNGVEAAPYYRLYNTLTRWHHWTSDANEYYTLDEFAHWVGEGVDGYILPTNTSGATQLYRLTYPPVAGLHHWTIDTNEYNTLIATYGWVGEGGAGFVIQ